MPNRLERFVVATQEDLAGGDFSLFDEHLTHAVFDRYHPVVKDGVTERTFQAVLVALCPGLGPAELVAGTLNAAELGFLQSQGVDKALPELLRRVGVVDPAGSETNPGDSKPH